ncbi:hypothetical protein RhiJN_21536 [Ceratobasidium sp. AG-Ba]|nr:hypothetical protein RhiJN_21536 [Ceratobasidium sp. AG-Ba]
MSKSVPDPNRGTLPKPQPRKLIVCIDGTSNKFSDTNTNVVELYNRITKDDTQLTYYNSGIGTYARPFWWSFAYLKQQVMNTVDLAIAWNFEKVVVGAYRWLSDNYRPGDKIFLFGFSRGAYQVRTLAAMIEHVGLIYPGNQEQIAFAWEVYSNDDPQCKKFKETFCRKSVDIHFVGVWDTVASVGALPRKPFPRSNSCRHVKHFRHALALDERRVKFLPEHIEDIGDGEQTLEQMWFVGTHSDIGGGNKVNTTLDRGGEPLKWMMEQAFARGLSVRMHDVKLGLPHAEVTDSMRKLKWLVLEVLPFLGWKNYLPDGKPQSSWRPHLMRAREKLPEHSIHWTVAASLVQDSRRKGADSYHPKAIVMENVSSGIAESSWESIGAAGDLSKTPYWADDNQSIRMFEILLNQPSQGNAQWYEKLCRYVLPAIKRDGNTNDTGGGKGDTVGRKNLEQALPYESRMFPRYVWQDEPGNAAAIWHYGGPRFLHDLFQNYPEGTSNVEIARSIIGFGATLKWNELPPAPKPGSSLESPPPPEQDVCTDLAVRLRDMVIPRISLLLEQWAAGPPEDDETKPARKYKILELFKAPKLDPNEPNPVDVNWDWDQVEKEGRSIKLACVVFTMIVDITKSKYAQVVKDASGPLADLVLKAMVALTELPGEVLDWKEDKAALAEAILRAMGALFEYDDPKEVFHTGKTREIISSFVGAREIHPSLARQAICTAALLVQDFYCGTNLAVPELIVKLAETMSNVRLGDDSIKQQLADEASSTLVKLSAHPWCSRMISEGGALSQLFELFGEGLYVDEILRVFKNVSTDYPENFPIENIGDLVKLMSKNPDASLALANIATQSEETFDITFLESYCQAGVANEIVTLLNHQDDAYVQAAALLVANLIDQEAVIRKKNKIAERYLVVPEISQALAASLGTSSRSQATIDILLKATSKYALQASIPDDLLTVVAPLASTGDKQAILTVISSAAYDESEREGIDRYLPTLFEMLVPSDEVHLKESMEALTILVKNGYNLPDPYPRVAVEKVAGVLQSATDGTFYTSDELYWIRDNVLTVALDLVEALCNNLLTANHVIQLSLLREVVLGLASNFNSGTFFDYANLMLSRLSNGDRYRELVQDLRKELNQPEPEPESKPDAGDETVDEQNEPEQESDDKYAEEYGIDETTPLISGD